MKGFGNYQYLILPLVLVIFGLCSSCAKQGSLVSSAFVKTLNSKDLCAIERYGQQVIEDATGFEVEGVYLESIAEDGIHSAIIIYQIVSDEGAVFELTGQLSVPGHSRVRAKLNPVVVQSKDLLGVLNPANKFKVEEFLLLNTLGPEFAPIVSNTKAMLSLSYNLSVAVYLLNFSNVPTSSSYSVEKASADVTELQAYYNRISQGQIKIDIDKNKDSLPDVEVINLNIAFEKTHCSNLEFFKQVTSQASPKNPVSQYTTPIFITLGSASSQCTYTGLAYLGSLGKSRNSTIHLVGPHRSVYVHEFGHTLGLNHSGAKQSSCPVPSLIQYGLTEYCEQSDPMGNFHGSELTFFNGVKIKELQLFTDAFAHLEKKVTMNATAPIQVDLSAVGRGYDSSNQMPRMLNLGDKFFLTHRYPIGEDADWNSSLNPFLGVGISSLDPAKAVGGTIPSTLNQILKKAGDTFKTPEGAEVKLISSIDAPQVKLEITPATGGGGGGGGGSEADCDPSMIQATPVQINRSGDGRNLELIYELENQQGKDCKPMEYTVQLLRAESIKGESAIATLINTSQVISLAPGQRQKVVTGLSVDRNKMTTDKLLVELGGAVVKGNAKGEGATAWKVLFETIDLAQPCLPDKL